MHKSHTFRALERKYKKETRKSVKKTKGFRIGHISLNTRKYVWWEIKNYFYNLCTVTSMHGFRYITAKRLSLNEKRVWVVICFLTLVLFIYFMKIAWNKSLNQLTFIQLDSIDNSVIELNFPAVTVCNNNQIYKPEADKLSENLTSAGFTNHQIQHFFQSLPILIRPFKFSKVDLETCGKMLQHLNIPVKKLMRQLMQPCENFISDCVWVNESYNCSTLFEVAESYLGNCCAFNYQVPPILMNYTSETEFKHFYGKNYHNKIQYEVDAESPGSKSILKVPGSGVGAALYFHVHLEPSKYLGVTKDFVGATILTHGSENFPEIDIHEHVIQNSKQKNIIMSGLMVESDEDIRKIPLKIRKCAFFNEIPLGYSYQSCIAKCKMIRFSKVCGCVPFYYHSTYRNIAKTCDFSNVKCIKRNIDFVRNLDKEIILENGHVLEKCNCSQICNKISYKAYSEHATIVPGYRYPYLSKKENEGRLFNFSIARVYFQDYVFMKYKRQLTSSWHQIISSLGGFFGLCLGGSFISILEPFVHLLMTHFRRVYDKKMLAKKLSERKANKERKYFSPTSKTRKNLPLKERLKKWDNVSAPNDISMLQSDFKMYLNFKRSKLVLPKGNK